MRVGSSSGDCVRVCVCVVLSASRTHAVGRVSRRRSRDGVWRRGGAGVKGIAQKGSVSVDVGAQRIKDIFAAARNSKHTHTLIYILVLLLFSCVLYVYTFVCNNVMRV